VLLPNTIGADATRYAVRVLLASRNGSLRPDGAPLTASAGVASTAIDGPVSGTLLRAADERLLDAKARGKDRVEAGATVGA
jgi:GGDEF domain-containing protein